MLFRMFCCYKCVKASKLNFTFPLLIEFLLYNSYFKFSILSSIPLKIFFCSLCINLIILSHPTFGVWMKNSLSKFINCLLINFFRIIFNIEDFALVQCFIFLPYDVLCAFQVFVYYCILFDNNSRVKNTERDLGHSLNSPKPLCRCTEKCFHVVWGFQVRKYF